MTLTAAGVQLIRDTEGKRNKAYPDGANYAIGYGFQTYSNGVAVRAGDYLSDAEIERELPKQLNIRENQTRALLSVNLTDNQFSALVSYVYNRGSGKFRDSVLRKKINANPFDSTIPAQFTIEWGTNQAGKVGLLKRRAREAALWQLDAPKFNNTNVLYFFLFLIFAFILYKVVKANRNIEKVPRKRTLQLST